MNNKERITAFALTAAITFGGVSCSNTEIKTRSPNSSTTVSETVKPGETTTKPSTETQTPAQKAEALLTQELNKELTEAPELAGTKKVLQDNGLGKEVTYVAENGNAYGVEANKFVGVYREKVTLDNKEVGGVALVPKVVEKLLKDSLKSNKWMLFVPADISEIKNSEAKMSLKIMDVNGINGKIFKNGALQIDFDSKQVSISNPILDGETKGIMTTTYTPCFDNTTLRGIKSNQLFGDSLNQDGLSVFGYLQFSLASSKVSFGTKMTETSSHIYENVQSKTAAADIDETHILKVSNSPVFMIDQ